MDGVVNAATNSHDPGHQAWNWLNVFVPIGALAGHVRGAVQDWQQGNYNGAGAQAAAAALQGANLYLSLPAMVLPFLGEIGPTSANHA